MGIDLAHVRYVVHWSLAKTLEGFYQESGRAGRDGLPAISVLFFSQDEVSTFSYLIQQQSSNAKDPQKAKQSATRSLDALQLMVSYCLTPCCRRQYLLQHFGETIQAKEVCNATCDYCVNPRKVEKAIDASQITKDIFSPTTVNASPANWDGQWDRPHGEQDEAGKDSDWEDNWTEGDLGIIAPADSLPRGDGRSESVAGAKSLTNVNSILAKYEVRSAQEFATHAFLQLTTNVKLPSPPCRKWKRRRRIRADLFVSSQRRVQASRVMQEALSLL
jgi:superfamily II DNA/RNA helicase